MIDTATHLDLSAETGATAASIPRGVADYFWQEAQERRGLEMILLDTFRRWGYGDVIPPMFEFADTLAARAGRQLQAEMYRFLDRDGSTLVLRPDMTMAVARLVAGRLHDWPMPQRFCYAGSVFRYTEPQAGRQREFFQAGIELIGAGAPAADAEVLALTIQALEDAGLTSFRVVLGQIQYFAGMLEDMQLSPAARQDLQRAVDRNSEAALGDFLRETPLRTQQRRTLEEFPLLSGQDVHAIIAQADRHCLNYTMHAALENLRAIYDQLDAYGVAHRIYLDLTEINDLGYYTGITFEALAPGLGFSIASGGRYDNLVGTFGPQQPAVGGAMGLDRILLARRIQANAACQPSPPAPQALVATNGSRDALALVQEWRGGGLRIAVDLNSQATDNPALLWKEAHATGISRLLFWQEDGFLSYSPDAQSPEKWTIADARQRMTVR